MFKFFGGRVITQKPINTNGYNTSRTFPGSTNSWYWLPVISCIVYEHEKENIYLIRYTIVVCSTGRHVAVPLEVPGRNDSHTSTQNISNLCRTKSYLVYSILSEGKINNTATRNDLYMYSRTQPSPPHDFFFLLVLPAERLVRDSA